MQRSRRTDPYPFTWEVPVAVAVTFVLVLVLGVHFGRAIANLLMGAGWTWPAQNELFRSLPAVLSGDSDAGLPAGAPGALGVVPGELASRTATYLWIAVSETTVTVLGAWGLVEGLRRWGPWRLHGMATRAEAEKLLGVSRLRKVRTVVRPDLHGKHARHGNTQPDSHDHPLHDTSGTVDPSATGGHRT